MTNGADLENGSGKDVPPWLQPVPEEELEEASFVSGKLKMLMIAGALITLSLFVAVIFYLYDDSAHVTPIHVAAPKTAIKQKPSEPGGLKVDYQDKVIFDQRDGIKPRGQVTLESQPETPVKEIPEGQLEVADPIGDMIDKAAAPARIETPIVEAEPVGSAPSQSSPSQSSLADTSVRREVSTKEVVANAKTTVEPVVSKPTPEIANAYRVQLGAYGSEKSAKRGWREARGLFPSEFAGKTAQYEDVRTGDRTLFRLRVGPFETRAIADQVCLALRAKEQACIVVNP